MITMPSEPGSESFRSTPEDFPSWYSEQVGEEYGEQQQKHHVREYMLAAMERGRENFDLVVAALGRVPRTVVDIGCDQGAVLFPFAFAGAERCVGVDVDKKAVATGERIAADFGCSQVSFVQTSAADMDLEDQQFEVVICQSMLEHVDDPAAVLSEIHRILHPEGFALISTPNRFGLLTMLSEPHVRLPLVSAMPSAFALSVVRRLRTGMNNAFSKLYTWPELLAMCRRAGLTAEVCEPAGLEKRISDPDNASTRTRFLLKTARRILGSRRLKRWASHPIYHRRIATRMTVLARR